MSLLVPIHYTKLKYYMACDSLSIPPPGLHCRRLQLLMWCFLLNMNLMLSRENDISLSDHYMTFYYTIYSKISRKTCLHKEINFRNYKRFNIDSFRNALSQNDNICNTSWSADQLADKWNKFKDGFIKISNKCSPMETRRLKHRNNPWINSHIIELIYERDYLKSNSIQKWGNVAFIQTCQE